VPDDLIARGCEQHGSWDCTEAIQAGIDRARGAGEKYRLSGGSHYLTRPLELTGVWVEIMHAQFHLYPGVKSVGTVRAVPAAMPELRLAD
jgi:hypothetical protein